MNDLRIYIAIAGLATAVAASAHHSFAMFDAETTTELTATVQSFAWTNPHCWLNVVTADAVVWGVEMGGPSTMYRDGWRQASVAPGDKISVTIHPLRDGRPGGSLISATLANGTQLKSAGPGTPKTEGTR